MSGQDCICTYLINVGSGLESVSFFYYSIETQYRGSKTNIRNDTSKETCKVTYNECGCRCPHPHPQPQPSPPPPPRRLYGYSFHLCIIYPIGGFGARDLNHCAFGGMDAIEHGGHIYSWTLNFSFGTCTAQRLRHGD